MSELLSFQKEKKVQQSDLRKQLLEERKQRKSAEPKLKSL